MTLVRRYQQFLERREARHRPQPGRWLGFAIGFAVIALGNAVLSETPALLRWILFALFALNAVLLLMHARRDRRRSRLLATG